MTYNVLATPLWWYLTLKKSQKSWNYSSKRHQKTSRVPCFHAFSYPFRIYERFWISAPRLQLEGIYGLKVYLVDVICTLPRLQLHPPGNNTCSLRRSQPRFFSWGGSIDQLRRLSFWWVTLGQGVTRGQVHNTYSVGVRQSSSLFPH